jgi:excinuclease ABC subunit A
MSNVISIRGARTHNLQSIDVDIPRGKLVVITGVSGSGKSSLAFDTLLAEGQRQYVQSLSVYSRQFFDQMERPDVDRIDGLSPTIAIDQRPAAPNPRSTVGTITEIYDYLRVLLARVGDVNCPNCGTPIAQQTPAEIEAAIRTLPENSRVMLLAPIVRGRRGAHREAFETIQKAGFVRARVNGVILPLEEVAPFASQQTHDIEAVVDRIVIRDSVDARLSESIRLALRHGDGVVIVLHQPPDSKSTDTWQEKILNTRYACPRCQTSIGEIEPRTFSFKSPYGACPTCGGLGRVPCSPDATACPLPQESDPASREHVDAREAMASEVQVCPACNGTRLRPEARAVKIGGLAIHEIAALTAMAALEFIRGLHFDEDRAAIAKPLLTEIARRLEFLARVGVDYLSLDRPADTLSGGERQRVRLATGIGSGLVGVLYLLDEPSIGLHPRDNDRLIAALRDLQQQGNSVVVVEHDEAIMRACDHLIDIGPGAGPAGGRIVAQGTPQEVASNVESLTGGYLSGRLSIEDRGARSEKEKSPRSSLLNRRSSLNLTGASANNLQNIDVTIPLHAFVCVTGVSGSGKSTLVVDTLVPAIVHALNARRTGSEKEIAPYVSPSSLRSIDGIEHINRLIQIDSSPIGRTPRANAATYTGIWNDIRRVFAATKQSRQRGYGAARFSFNAAGGRCEECRGAGVRRIAMNFLPDLEVTCPVCHGRRFNRATLAVHFRGKSIADVLNLSVAEAVDFFANHASIHRVLTTLADVGLSYLTLGQPATTLSGGEAQRIKLAAELAQRAVGHTLYILDDPTTGLATDDIGRLLNVLHRLVEQSNSMLVIEHNLDVIKTADWVIDLGPEGGAAGGRIVVAGTPQEVARCEASHTGRFLRSVLNSKPHAESQSRKGNNTY